MLTDQTHTFCSPIKKYFADCILYVDTVTVSVYSYGGNLCPTVNCPQSKVLST